MSSVTVPITSSDMFNISTLPFSPNIFNKFSLENSVFLYAILPFKSYLVVSFSFVKYSSTSTISRPVTKSALFTFKISFSTYVISYFSWLLFATKYPFEIGVSLFSLKYWTVSPIDSYKSHDISPVTVSSFPPKLFIFTVATDTALTLVLISPL